MLYPFNKINKELEEVFIELNKLSSNFTDLQQKKLLYPQNIIEKIFPFGITIENIETLKEQLKETNNSLKELLQKKEGKIKLLEPKPEIVKIDKPDPLSLDIIRLRDQLLIFKSTAEGTTAEMISNLYKELGRILSRHGVQPIEDIGTFNKIYHTVVDIRNTDEMSLNETIAETFRPGYKTDNQIIRHQEVILYKYKTRSFSY